MSRCRWCQTFGWLADGYLIWIWTVQSWLSNRSFSRSLTFFQLKRRVNMISQEILEADAKLLASQSELPQSFSHGLILGEGIPVNRRPWIRFPKEWNTLPRGSAGSRRGTYQDDVLLPLGRRIGHTSSKSCRSYECESSHLGDRRDCSSTAVGLGCQEQEFHAMAEWGCLFRHMWEEKNKNVQYRERAHYFAQNRTGQSSKQTAASSRRRSTSTTRPLWCWSRSYNSYTARPTAWLSSRNAAGSCDLGIHKLPRNRENRRKREGVRYLGESPPKLDQLA